MLVAQSTFRLSKYKIGAYDVEICSKCGFRFTKSQNRTFVFQQSSLRLTIYCNDLIAFRVTI